MSAQRDPLSAADRPAGAGRPPHFRRNFTLGVLNGVMFNLAFSLISSSLVLPGLIRQLGGGNVLVGLLPALENGGWFLPQLLVGTRIQSRPCKLSVYRLASVLRSIIFGLMVLTIALAGRLPPAVTLTLFLVLYGSRSLVSGVAGIPFQDIVAKAIPPRRRGSFFGMRQFGGGLLTLLVASPLVGYVLADSSPLAFPQNYTLLFGLAYVLALVGLLSFSLVVEPPSHELGQAGRLRAQLRLLPQIWRGQLNLRRFLAFRVLARLALLAEPFYIVYIIERQGAPQEIVGRYLGMLTIVQLLSYLLWSWLSDQRGNRLLLRLGSGLAAVAPLLALLLPPLAGRMGLSPLATAYLFAAVFAVSGLGQAGLGIGSLNYILEVLSERDRPAALGLVNTIIGLVSFLMILGGGLIDLVGFGPLFMLAFALALAGFALSLAMPEPRMEGLGESETRRQGDKGTRRQGV